MEQYLQHRLAVLTEKAQEFTDDAIDAVAEVHKQQREEIRNMQHTKKAEQAAKNKAGVCALPPLLLTTATTSIATASTSCGFTVVASLASPRYPRAPLLTWGVLRQKEGGGRTLDGGAHIRRAAGTGGDCVCRVPPSAPWWHGEDRAQQWGRLSRLQGRELAQGLGRVDVARKGTYDAMCASRMRAHRQAASTCFFSGVLSSSLIFAVFAAAAAAAAVYICVRHHLLHGPEQVRHQSERVSASALSDHAARHAKRSDSSPLLYDALRCLCVQVRMRERSARGAQVGRRIGAGEHAAECETDDGCADQGEVMGGSGGDHVERRSCYGGLKGIIVNLPYQGKEGGKKKGMCA